MAALLSLQLAEVLLRQVCERGDYVLANQVLGLGQVALLRNLDLQVAFAKVEVEDFDDARCRGGRDGAFVLFDLVAAGDSEVNAAFADEGGDVGGGEEDEREREVLDERNVEARVAVELDVGAVEEVEADLVEAALCLFASEMHRRRYRHHWGWGTGRLGDLLLGTAKSNRSLRLLPSVSVMNGKLRLPLRALCMMNSSSLAPLGAPLVRDMVQTMYGGQKGESRTGDQHLRIDQIHGVMPSTQLYVWVRIWVWVWVWGIANNGATSGSWCLTLLRADSGRMPTYEGLIGCNGV